MNLSPAEARFLEKAKAGDGWYVYQQVPMIRRLMRRGLIHITDRRRYNALRGSNERLAEAVDRGPG